MGGRECKIYLNNGGYSRAKIIHILRLLHEDIGHHFGQQGSICMSIQSTEVKQFGNIKQEILIDDLGKHLRSQPVLLSTDNSKQMVQYSDHYRLHMKLKPPTFSLRQSMNCMHVCVCVNALKIHASQIKYV